MDTSAVTDHDPTVREPSPSASGPDHATLDQQIIARYTGQPARMPAALRRRIERDCRGAPVQLYACADLDEQGQLDESWLALGPRHVVVARPDALGGREIVKRIAAVVATANGRRFMLLGDNAAWSTDSRSYGPVSEAEVRGRILLRYWPDHRRGPVR